MLLHQWGTGPTDRVPGLGQSVAAPQMAGARPARVGFDGGRGGTMPAAEPLRVWHGGWIALRENGGRLGAGGRSAKPAPRPAETLSLP